MALPADRAGAPGTWTQRGVWGHVQGPGLRGSLTLWDRCDTSVRASSNCTKAKTSLS